MADKRRLQGDIDRTLKRVAEGRQSFQEIMDKFQSASNQTQKEKFEADLKKEIKKLQRLRDQIKTWLTNNEIKDKRTLLEARKDIESDMERFKVIEKETKTKMYSKEGLCMEQKRDPRDKEKEEMGDWLRGRIAILTEQYEKYEYEIENLSNAIKRKRGIDKEKQDIIEEKRSHMENHQFHISKLEACMRLLDNDRLDLDVLKNVKESVVFYCDDHGEPDFIIDDTIYDDLNLDEVADMSLVGTLAGGHEDHNDSLREADDSLEEDREEESTTAACGEAGQHHGASSRSSSPPHSMSSRVSAEERSVASSSNSFEPREQHKPDNEPPSTPLKLPGLPTPTPSRQHSISQSGHGVPTSNTDLAAKSGTGESGPTAPTLPSQQQQPQQQQHLPSPSLPLPPQPQDLPQQPPPSQQQQASLTTRQLSHSGRQVPFPPLHSSVPGTGKSDVTDMVIGQQLDTDNDAIKSSDETPYPGINMAPASLSACAQAAMQSVVAAGKSSSITDHPQQQQQHNQQPSRGVLRTPWTKVGAPWG